MGNSSGIEEMSVPGGGVEAVSLPLPTLTPARITAIYLLLGGVALFFSDALLPMLLADPLLGQAQAVKGALEVVLTAGLIYALTASREGQLRRMTERLERENRELDLLHRVLRHNLRNDLNVIIAAIDRIRASAPASDVPQECAQVEAVAGRMEKYTADAKRIRKVEEEASESGEFDLAACFRELAAAGAGGPPGGVRLTTALPESLPVTGNYMLPEALEELVRNALSPVGPGEGRIEVSLQHRSEETVTVRLAGEGVAVPDADLEAIRRGDEDDLVHANGLGLWFVVWTVERSGGRIDFDTTDGRLRIELTLVAA